MKKCIVLLACTIALVLSGCITSYRDAGGDGLTRPSNGNSDSYRTEYEIGQEAVTGTGGAEVILWFFHVSDGKVCQLYRDPHISLFGSILSVFSPTEKAIFNAKGAALYNALENSNADHIVGATFDYEVQDSFFFIRVKCSVKGYPAKVKKISNIDKIPVIVNEWQKIEYVAPSVMPKDYSNKMLPEHRVKML